LKRSSENAGHTDEGRVEWANANFLQLAYSMSQLQARGEHVVGAVRLMSDGRQQAEQGLALAAEAGTVIVDIQDGAQKVVSAVGQFANQLSN
jgi:hypothetical protein